MAVAAKVSADTVVRFEQGEKLRERTIDAIRAALESAGVEFIPENGGGAGVRLRKPADDDRYDRFIYKDAKGLTVYPPEDTGAD